MFDAGSSERLFALLVSPYMQRAAGAFAVQSFPRAVAKTV